MNETQRTNSATRQSLLRRPSVISALAFLGLFAFVGAVVLVLTIHNSLAVPKIERPAEVKLLWQNWTDNQSHSYYHTAQGSELLPYAWFLALEQPRFTIMGAPPFTDCTY